MSKFQQYAKSWIKNESLPEKKARAKKIDSILKKTYPGAGMALKYSNNVQLLVAVILSAQCTDKKVNEVTASLFSAKGRKYKTAHDFATANVQDLEKIIRPTGFYHAKAKSIIAACALIKKDFAGKVPDTMADILRLRGVARKTANIVLGNAYNIVEGIAVDTHVSRLSQRLGLTKSTDPVKIEQDLMKLFPQKDWFTLTYRLIEHGRAICASQRRKCEICPLSKIGPSSLV